MKKILSLVLAMLMVFSVVPAVFADDAVTTAAKDSDYQDAIDFLELLDVYNGAGSGHADAEGVTRWQMALYVARIITGRTDDAYWATTENDSGFADVAEFLNDEESYRVGAISYAANQGIINGYGDGNFGPNDGITYRDALTMVVRALGTTYPASGYPWSYVTKADELGLMDGITGVGQTEEISREVVAQILYNAINADVNGKTVAEDVFGVGTMTVIITASNAVAYNGSAKVVRDGFVQFSAIDEQGEPTGAKYHVAATAFGLADDKAENAAVGTNYQIVYKDNCVEIIDATALWTTYENFAGNNEIVIDGAKKTISLGGVSSNLVTVYTNLFNTQGTANATGADETKVYGSNNVGAWKTIGTKYYMDAQGYIYEIEDLELVAYYFQFFGELYGCTVESTGKYTYSALTDADKKEIMDDLTAYSDVFAQVTDFASLKDSAYTKVVASDCNNDGMYDRAIIKDYQFGYLDYTNDAKTNVTLYTKSGLNEIATASAKAGYRFTGIKPAADAYVIYYVDDVNKEIDVWVEVPAYTEGATTYYADAYILGFSVAKSIIYMNDTKSQRFDMSFGYADLNGAPMVAFTTGANANVTANNALIDLLLASQNSFVKYVVVDGKLVYFTTAAESEDYVVIDSFDITTEGVKAHAYTTVDDEWTTIEIAEFNGWNIGGFDWETMWYNKVLENLLKGEGAPNANEILSTLLPIKANQLYRVVYENDGAYNLRAVSADEVKDVANQVHIENGKIHWFKDDAYVAPAEFTKFDSSKQDGAWANTSASHDWLILQVPEVDDVLDITNIEKVYVVPGKIANIAIDEFDLYKAANDDFVLAATEEALADFILSQKVGADINYVYYNKYDLTLNDWNNQWADQSSDARYYWRWMRDVATGNHGLVMIDMAEFADVIAELNKIDAKASPEDYVILQINNGYLSLVEGQLPTVDMNTVATFYQKGNAFDYNHKIENIAAADLLAVVGDYLDVAYCGMNSYVDTNDYFGKANITFIGVSNGDYVRKTGDKIAEANFTGAVNAYICWNKDEQKAIVYVAEAGV